MESRRHWGSLKLRQLLAQQCSGNGGGSDESDQHKDDREPGWRLWTLVTAVTLATTVKCCRS
jgi:hypothetical protein